MMHVTNHLTEKQLFTRFSAHGGLYLATLVNAQTAFPFQAVWNVRSGYISFCSLPFNIFKAKLAFSSLLYGNDEILLHAHFNLTGHCLLGSLVTYMKVKDTDMNKIGRVTSIPDHCPFIYLKQTLLSLFSTVWKL